MKQLTFPSGLYYVPKKNIADTLFNTGGTASGYYKKLKRGITFYNMQDEPFLHLVSNSHNEHFFISCFLFNGRKRYMYAVSSNTEKMLGLDTLKYSEGTQLAENMWHTINN